MSKPSLVATVVLVAVCLAVGHAAHAQSVADVEQVTTKVRVRMLALDTARKNLHQMEYHRNGPEADGAQYIMSAGADMITLSGEVLTVGSIVTHMKSPDDLHYAQRVFASVAALFVTTADASLDVVNYNIRDVSAPAALTEATKIRDAIVELRDIAKPFATPKN